MPRGLASGSVLRCPNCKQQFGVGSPSANVSDPRAKAANDDPPPLAPLPALATTTAPIRPTSLAAVAKKKSSSFPNWLLLGCGGGIIALLLMLAAFFFAVRQGLRALATSAKNLEAPASPFEHYEPLKTGQPRCKFPWHRPPCFGGNGCSLAVIGDQVWDFDTMSPVRKLMGLAKRPRAVALSPGGRWFAAGVGNDDTNVTVGIWSLTTGELAWRLPTGGQSGHLLQFLRDDLLLVSDGKSKSIALWSLVNEEPSRHDLAMDGRFDNKDISVSPDGRHFAAISPLNIDIYDVNDGTRVRRIEQAQVKGVKRWGFFKAVQFSPAGEDLAAISGVSQDARLHCWNAKGDLTLDIPIPGGGSAFASLQWLPDGSGWLADGRLIERDFQRVVLAIHQSQHMAASPEPFHFLDRQRLLVVRGRVASDLELKVLRIPWQAIQESKQLLDTRQPAMLSPGTPVEVQVEIRNARGETAAALAAMREAFVKRLAAAGISISNEPAAVIFKLTLSEAAGQRQRVVDFHSAEKRDLGIVLTQALGTLSIELLPAGATTPIWRETLNARSGNLIDDDVSDQALRRLMLTGVYGQIEGLEMPYFIPSDKNHAELPLVFGRRTGGR